MRHQDPIDLIRDRNPVSDAHQLPDGPHSASAEALFEEIIGMENHKTTPIRRPKFGRTAALVAALLVVSAGAAVAAGVFSPDPADVATIEKKAEEVVSWQSSLQTGAVWCMYDVRTGADTSVVEFPVGEPLTVEALLAECATGNDVVRNLDEVPAQFTMCEGTFTDQEYANRITSDDRFNIIAGDLSADRPGFPVVLAWEADCASTTLETSVAVDLAPMRSLDQINKAREIEIGLKASAINTCLTRSGADTMARNARADLGESWLLVDYNLNGPVSCYAVDIEPEWGLIGVLGQNDGAPGEGTPSTEPPSDN